MRKTISFLATIFLLLLSSCQVLNAFESLGSPSETPTQKPTFTPTITLTPTITPSPTIAPTATNTPTPEPGSFENPFHIGDTTDLVPFGNIQSSSNQLKVFSEWRFNLLEIKTGDDAKQQAKSSMRFYYREPIENQEYLAIYGTIEVVTAENMNETEAIFPNWSFTLRYEEEGDDISTVEVLSEVRDFDSGYPPFERTGWFFFLIREGSQPYLYFQPNIAVSMKAWDGVRNRGVYFWLWDEN